MFTVILAWINAKYKANYMAVFFGTVILDFVLLCLIGAILSKVIK